MHNPLIHTVEWRKWCRWQTTCGCNWGTSRFVKLALPDNTNSWNRKDRVLILALQYHGVLKPKWYCMDIKLLKFTSMVPLTCRGRLASIGCTCWHFSHPQARLGRNSKDYFHAPSYEPPVCMCTIVLCECVSHWCVSVVVKRYVTVSWCASYMSHCGAQKNAANLQRICISR